MTTVPNTKLVEHWRPLFEQHRGDLPIGFILAWITEESGGNPCAIGVVVNPPQEWGIAQLNYPDDEKFGKREPMRAYCAAWGNTRVQLEAQTRPLTPDEETYEVQASIGLITHCETVATSVLIQNGYVWRRDHTDFWCMVKMYHGLPALVGGAFPYITRKLGRQVAGFDELGAEILKLTPQEMAANPALHSLQNYRAKFASVVENAKFAGRRAFS